MRAVICPVCNGGGRLDGGTKYEKDKIPVRIINPCHGCNGKGWVSVLDNADNLNYYGLVPSTSDPNKCPSCGGDRNSPAGTGCPWGSHYGNYCKVK